MKSTWICTTNYTELINIYIEEPEENTEYCINIFTIYVPSKSVQVMNLENLRSSSDKQCKYQNEHNSIFVLLKILISGIYIV